MGSIFDTLGEITRLGGRPWFLSQDSYAQRNLLDRILLDKQPDLGLDFLEGSHILRDFLPEVNEVVGFGGKGTAHKNLWHHVKQVVCQADPEPAIRWAALFHDVGKPMCFEMKDGEVTFHGHEACSAKMFWKAAERTMLFEEPLKLKIHNLVIRLGHVEGYSSDWTDSAVRRAHREVGEDFFDLLRVARADVTSVHLAKRERVQGLVDELRERALKLAEEDAKPKALPKGLGTTISQALSIPPSKALGDLMKVLQEAVESGELARDLPVESYVEFARTYLLKRSLSGAVS